MPKVFRVALIVFASLLLPARSDVVRTHPSSTYRAEVTLANWNEGGELSRWVYTHPSEVFPTAVVRRDGEILALTEALKREIGEVKTADAKGASVSLYELLDRGEVDGCIVLHAGKVAFEQYPAMQPNDFHLVFEVSGCFLATAAEILEAQGRVDLARPAERYLAELKKSAWTGIPLRDLIQNSNRPAEDASALEAVLGWRPVRDHDGLFPFLAGAKTRSTASDAEVLALALERATGKSLADLISETIWSRMGAEHDALLVTNARGYPLAHAGLAMTLRDLARFGLLFTKGAGIPEKIQPGFTGHDQELLVIGRGGQLLYVNRARDVVIAAVGTGLTSKGVAPLLPVRAIAELF